MGPRPSKPTPLPSVDVMQTRNENGLHFFTINLDANQDGHGVSPWAVVGIIVLTVLGMYILKKTQGLLHLPPQGS